MKPMVSRVFALLCISALITIAHAQPTAPSSPTWQVYFSPGGEATYAVCHALNNAKSNVFVQAYSFTSAPIAEALVKAHKRGIKVQVILDRSQSTQKYSSADFLANSGIPTRIDAAHAIAHSKIMIIDNKIVITGSFNFTKAAEEKNQKTFLLFATNSLLPNILRIGDAIRHILKSTTPKFCPATRKEERPDLFGFGLLSGACPPFLWRRVPLVTAAATLHRVFEFKREILRRADKEPQVSESTGTECV